MGPSYQIDAAKLIALAPMIRSVAVRRGVAERYIQDLVQKALFQAWRAMTVGRFRLAPGADVDMALRAWVVGVAFNQVMNFQVRAFHHREVPYPDAARDHEQASEIPEPRYEARAVMRLAADIFPSELRPVFILMMHGLGAEEIAFILDTPPWIVRRRMTEVRKRLAALADGEG